MHQAEPNWIEVTTIGSSYDVEIDVNARPNAPDSTKIRHRKHPFTGEFEREWSSGPAPVDNPIPA